MKADLRMLSILAWCATLIVVLLLNLACTTPQTPQANRPPKIEQIIGSSEWAPLTDDQVTCSASDPDGDKLTYTWLADNGTIRGEGHTITWTSPAAMGKYNLTVIVNDGRGGEARMVKEVKVVINSDGSLNPDAPVVLKMSLSSKDVASGSKRIRIWTSAPVECIVDGAETKNLKYIWTASNGKLQGKGLNEGTASKVTWIAPGVAGDYTLDVVVTDNNGNEAKGTVNFKVFCCGN